MTEKNMQLLGLINEGKTINEICNVMNISYKQLSSRLLQLKKWGINLDRKYYYDGESSYEVSKDINKKKNNETVILTRKEDTNFRTILISDLHIGNKKERIDTLEKIYNFAIKEDIHIILNTGDLIDGTIGKNKIHNSSLEQIKYALKVHPYDKNILNFICLGNHDASTKEKYGFDFGEVLKNNRPDLIPVGYGMGCIVVKNDKIFLSHHLDNVNMPPIDNGLCLKGHTHTTRFVHNGNGHFFSLPTLSGMGVKKESAYPCAFLMDLKMNNGYFVNGIFNQLFVDSKVCVLNELVYDLNNGKPMTNGYDVLNEEERSLFVPSEEREQDDKQGQEMDYVKKMSQIDKFNQRYGYKNL